MVNNHYCWIFREIRSFNKRKLHNFCRPASAALNIQCALPAAAPRLLTLRRVCHSCSAGLPSQRLIKLQFRDRLCIRMRTRISHQPIMPGFSCQVCRMVKIPARGLPLLLLEQSAAVHSPPPVVSARVRLPVQLLARRHAPVSVAPSPARRKAQAHPPAATATPSRAKASTQVRPIPAPPTVTTAAFFAKTNFLHNSIST